MPANMEIEAPLNAPKVKPGARRRRLTPLGQGWKRGLYPAEMGMPEASVNAMLTFEEAPPLKDIADAFEKSIWPRYRFHSVVVDMDFVEQDGPMDRAYHFQERTMSSTKEIEDHVFRQATQSLDPNRPLWRFEIIRNTSGEDAVVLKLHHCISDGLGVLFTFLPMLGVKSTEHLLDTIPLPAALKGGVKSPGENPMDKLSEEEKKMGCCRRRCNNTRSFWKGFCSVLTMAYDSEVKINPPIEKRKPFLPFSGRQRYTKMPVVDCKLISVARKVHNCTFNDVVMAGLSGAFRRYMIEHTDEPLFKKNGGEVECKSFMLLALPRPVKADEPDLAIVNNFLTPVLKLAVNQPTAKERMDATIQACNDLKSRSFIAGVWTITKMVAAVMCVNVFKKVASEALSKLTCNITSVPLPDEVMSFAGKNVTGVQVIFVNNIPQISILSYKKELHWNIVSDSELLTDPELIGKYFVEELEALGKAIQLS